MELRVLYTNTDQFINKRDDMLMLIAGDEPDLIIIMEILPKVHCYTISPACLAINGYNTFYNFDPSASDPIVSIHGVGIYISDKLPLCEVNFTNSTFSEHVWVQLNLRGHDNLLIGCLYRSPSSDSLTSTQSLCNLLSSMHEFSHIGDFNYPDINWSLFTCSSSPS